MVLTGLRSSLKIFLWLAILLCLESTHSCKKENIQPLSLISIEANGVDLNSKPTGVSIKVPIKVTFTTGIDPLSISSASVLMTRDYDHAGVLLSFIVSGSLLSIKPVTDLISGAFYTLNITSDVKSTHGDAFGSLTLNFKTAGVFVPSNQVAYWNFENTPPDDVVGPYDPLSADVEIEYAKSKNDSSGRAASFNGTTSFIQIAKGATLLKPEFTISFWMKLNSVGHVVDSTGKQKGSFVMGIGNTHGLQFEVDSNYVWCRFSQGLLLSADPPATTTNDFQFFANGVTKDNVQTNSDSLIARGIDNATVFNQDFGAAGLKQRLDNVWAQIIMSFTDSTKTRTLYINGEKMYKQDLSLLANPGITVNPALRPLATVKSLTFIPDADIPARYDDKLVFGFWQGKESTFGGAPGRYFNKNANHFQGLLDDVRIFNRALTDTEVSLMYESEKPF